MSNTASYVGIVQMTHMEGCLLPPRLIWSLKELEEEMETDCEIL